MNVPSDLLYTAEHEWLRKVDATTAVIGITDYAQNSLGDITYVEMPPAGATLAAGGTFGVVESVKAASDLYAPVDATVIEANEALDAAPETVNQDPYEAGWMVKVKLSDPGQLEGLMSPEAYEKHIAD